MTLSTKTRASARTTSEKPAADKASKQGRSTKTTESPAKGPSSPAGKVFKALSSPSNPNANPHAKGKPQFSHVRTSVVNPRESDSSSGCALHFQRDAKTPGVRWQSWPDKLFHDAFRDQHEWLKGLNFFPGAHKLHHRGSIVLTTRGHAVRVCLFFTGESLTPDRLREVANCIRDQMNEKDNDLRDDQKVVVDDNLVVEEHSTWCDVIGDQGALTLAKKLHGNDLTELRDHFLADKDALFTFWAKNQMPAETARRLRMPPSMAGELGLTEADFDLGDFEEQVDQDEEPNFSP